VADTSLQLQHTGVPCRAPSSLHMLRLQGRLVTRAYCRCTIAPPKPSHMIDVSNSQHVVSCIEVTGPSRRPYCLFLVHSNSPWGSCSATSAESAVSHSAPTPFRFTSAVCTTGNSSAVPQLSHFHDVQIQAAHAGQRMPNVAPGDTIVTLLQSRSNQNDSPCDPQPPT
jgi:hypothetical protein